MQKNHIPGLAIAVVHKKELVWAKGFGVTSVGDNGIEVTPDTLFRIGSITKPLTAAVIMRLVDQNVLDLDQPIRTYIPWLKLHSDEACDKLTLRMLLTHSSGYMNGGDAIGGRDTDALEKYVRFQLPEIPFFAPPGLLFSYSNHNYNLAGFVAEYVSGKRFTDLMNECLFKPLGMSRTTFDPLVALTYQLALPHLLADGELKAQHLMIENVACHPFFFAMSTVNDLARFAILHMNEGVWGEDQILSPDSYKEMHHGQVPYASTFPGAVAVGFHVQERYKGYRVSRHFGDISSYSGDFVMLPDHDTAVIILNNMPAFPHDTITDAVLAQLLPEMKETNNYVPKENIAVPHAEGTYLGERKGLVEIQREGDTLLISLNQEEPIPLTPIKSGTWNAVNQAGEHVCTVGILTDDMGETYLLVNNSLCVKIDLSDTSPPSTELRDYTGKYAHHGLEEWSYLVTLNGDELIVEADGMTEKLVHIDRDVFVGPLSAVLRFQVNEAGTVASFLLHSGWIMQRDLKK